MTGIAWVLPGDLRLPPSRRSVALAKLARQVRQYGTDLTGMPAIEVTGCAGGELVINDGVIRATRAHRYANPGALVPIVVIDERPNLNAKSLPRIADVG